MLDINRIRSNIQQHYKDKDEAYVKSRQEENRKHYAKYYHSKQWQTLRNNYYVAHPLCECCLLDNIVTQGEEVHHLHVWSKGITEEAKWNLLLNYQNLATLCPSCHKAAHELLRKTNKNYVTLDEIRTYKHELNSYE